MAEDALIKDFKWNDAANVSDEPIDSGSRVNFGWLRVAPLNVTKSYTPGEYVTVPGIVGGQYQEKDAAGNMKLKGYTAGGSLRLFVLCATKLDKDGMPYQIVKQYAAQPQRKDEPHVWKEFVLPAFMAVPDEQRSKLLATPKGAPARWEEIGTGHFTTLKDRETGEDKQVEYKAWVNFHVYANEAEMKAASDTHFAQFAAAGNGTVKYPDHWAGSEQAMLDWVKTELAKPDAVLAQVATEAGLTAENTPDYKKILAGVLGVPEPMVSL